MFANNRSTPSSPPIMSQINVDVRIRGTVTVSEPLIMAGQIDGNIEADAVVIGDITAQNIVIDGKITGNITAENVHLTEKARFEGKMQCQCIRIDNGAYIDAKFINQ